MAKNPNKELYQQLRALSCEQLWREEVPRFDRATAAERIARVALVRAVGVVFSENGTEEQKEQVRAWLRGLLQDPEEKIRRYAMAALPKIGAGVGEEAELLALLRKTEGDREKKFLGQTLEKIGGSATLEEMGEGGLHLRTEQKVKASVARSQGPSAVQMERTLDEFSGLRIHLRGRMGLESFVREEVEATPGTRVKFRVEEVRPGLVVLTPVAPFALGDLYALRCFGTVGFVLGVTRSEGSANAETPEAVEALAAVIASPLTRRLLQTFTEGAWRYRLDFVGKGHQRGAVQAVAMRAYARCPDILNDSRQAPWTIAIRSAGRGQLVELIPKLVPDPRFAYRQQDVPAASHPPLAVCMARLAGPGKDEVIWDPFCGSGLELIERARLGGVRRLYGTDRSEEAIAITEANFEAARVESGAARFVTCDFRDFGRIEGLGAGAATLVITNPPMGKRVPIPNLRGLIADLFAVAADVLKPGGRLVFANPLHLDSPERSLKLQFRQVVDFGGFDCRLEKYVKL